MGWYDINLDSFNTQQEGDDETEALRRARLLPQAPRNPTQVSTTPIDRGSSSATAVPSLQSTVTLRDQTDVQGVLDGSAGTVNAFSRIKLFLGMGRSCALMNWSDSTGNDPTSPREWPYLLADKIAQEYPAFTVVIVPWNDTSGAWDTAITIRSAGAGAPVFTLWNFAIPAVGTHYALGTRFLAALRTVPVDGLIINHGINHAAGDNRVVMRGEFFTAVETYRLYHPGVPISTILQSPRRDNNDVTGAVEAWRTVAAISGVQTINVYDEFFGPGKPQRLYVADQVHPSAGGQGIYLRKVWQHFLTAKATIPPVVTSLFATAAPPDVNLLLNGHFKNYPSSPGLPTGWTAAGGAGYTMVPTKETTIVSDDGLGYSVRLLGTGNTSRIVQAITGATLNAVKGQPITLAVKRWVDESASSNVGRCQIYSVSAGSGAVFETTRAYVTRQTGWVWWVLSGFIVPADATSLEVRLNHDTAASPSAVPAHFDQVSLVPGYAPRAAR